jgi:hypothetical protein
LNNVFLERQSVRGSLCNTKNKDEEKKMREKERNLKQLLRERESVIS